MRELGFITRAQAEAAASEPLMLVAHTRAMTNVAAPYFVETVRKDVAERYGDEDLLRRGFRIYTTLDMRRQRAAESALRRGLEDLQRRLGFDGPIGHLDVRTTPPAFIGPAAVPVGPKGFHPGRRAVPVCWWPCPTRPLRPWMRPSRARTCPTLWPKLVAGEAWAQRRRAAKSRDCTSI